MSNTYNHYLVLVIPDNEQILATAKAASRALDPDVGGYFSFDQVIGAYRHYASPVTEGTAQAIQFLRANPGMLQATIARDYGMRWHGESAPTVAECEAFCAALQIFMDMTVDAVLEEIGLVK
jgi:hypothetical protein